MASKQFEYVNLMQNGVLKKIIVPTAANKPVSSLGEVETIFGSSITPATTQSSVGQSINQLGSQIYAPYVSRSMNVERPASPNLVQARNKLSGALAKNRVYLTSAQGIGTLSNTVNAANVTSSTPFGTQSVPTSMTGKFPVLLLQGQQPTLVQSQQPTLVQGQQNQQVLLTNTNTQHAQVVMRAQGKPAFLLPMGLQGQSNPVVQFFNSGGVLPNSLGIRTAHGTANVTQLASAVGQNVLYQVPVQAPSQIQANSTPCTSSSFTQNVNMPTGNVATGASQNNTSGNIQIGSVFSLKDTTNSPYSEAELSKVFVLLLAHNSNFIVRLDKMCQHFGR